MQVARVASSLQQCSSCGEYYVLVDFWMARQSIRVRFLHRVPAECTGILLEYVFFIRALQQLRQLRLRLLATAATAATADAADGAATPSTAGDTADAAAAAVIGELRGAGAARR
jgi:hypothetical protein